MAPAPRPTAAGGRVSRAATRYRPGKVAPGLAVNDDDDSDIEGDEQRLGTEARDEAITDLSSATAALGSGKARLTAGVVIEQDKGRIDVNLSGVRLGQTKKEEQEDSEGSSEYETDTDEEEAKPAPKPIFRKPGAAPDVKEESSEYETDSEEEESSKEEEKQMLKPVFVPKRARATINNLEAQATAAEEAEKKREEEAEARRMESHLLAADRIKKELAEKDHEDAKPDLDDTDGLDPEAEFAAWRLRELERLKRERDAQAEKEALEAEKERRRNMTEEERMKEDLDKAKKSREEKSKGSQGFLQKYYHKGAFFQDMDILKKHDFTEGTSRDAVDRSLLPKAMQVRDFGKRSRSKWTHLANEDTSRKQYVDPRFRDGEGSAAAGETMGLAGKNGTAPANGLGGSGMSCFNCGGPHLKRDCPNLGGGGAAGQGQEASATGANKTMTAPRSWGRPREDDAGRVPSKRVRDASPEGSHSRRRREEDRYGGESRGGRERHDDRRSYAREDRDRDRDGRDRGREEGDRHRNHDRRDGQREDRDRYRSRDDERDRRREDDRDRRRDDKRDRLSHRDDDRRRETSSRRSRSRSPGSRSHSRR